MKKSLKFLTIGTILGVLLALVGPPIWNAIAEPIRLRGSMQLQSKDDVLDASMLVLKNAAGTTVYSVSVAGVTAGGAVTIGSTGTQIADSYANSAVIDFADIGNTTADSAGITVTGAALGDTCEVGTDLNATWVTGSDFSCRVSAANTVIVRHQCIGASCNPGSDTFHVRTFDP